MLLLCLRIEQGSCLLLGVELVDVTFYMVPVIWMKLSTAALPTRIDLALMAPTNGEDEFIIGVWKLNFQIHDADTTAAGLVHK